MNQSIQIPFVRKNAFQSSLFYFAPKLFNMPFINIKQLSINMYVWVRSGEIFVRWLKSFEIVFILVSLKFVWHLIWNLNLLVTFCLCILFLVSFYIIYSFIFLFLYIYADWIKKYVVIIICVLYSSSSFSAISLKEISDYNFKFF